MAEEKVTVYVDVKFTRVVHGQGQRLKMVGRLGETCTMLR